MPILEQDALRVANSLGQLDEPARKEAGALLNAYLDQQEKLGAPLWPSIEEQKKQQHERARNIIYDPLQLDKEDGTFLYMDELNPGAGDKFRNREAAQIWTATKFGADMNDVRERWSFYKAELGEKWGTGVLDDSAFFNRAKQEQQKEDARVDLYKSAQDAAFQSAIAGGDDLADFGNWQATQDNEEAWQDATHQIWSKTRREISDAIGPNRELIAKAPEAMRRLQTGAATDADRETLDRLAWTVTDATGKQRQVMLRALAHGVRKVAEEQGRQGIAGTATIGVERLIENGFGGARFGESTAAKLDPTQPLRVGPITNLDDATRALDTLAKAEFAERVPFDPDAPQLPEARQLTPEEQALMQQAKERVANLFKTERELKQLAIQSTPLAPTYGELRAEGAGFFDALARGGMGSAVSGATQSLALIAPALLGPGGAVLVGGGYANMEYEQLLTEYPDMSAEDAARVAVLSGGIQAALDKATLFGLDKFSPNLRKLLTGNATRELVKQAVGKTAGLVTFENFIEGLQDVTTPVVQAVLSDLKNTVPAVDWDREFTEFADSRADVFIGMLPLMLIGAGVNTARNREQAKALMSDNDALARAGYVEADRIAAIEKAQAGDVEGAAAVLEEGFDRRSPELAAEMGNEQGAKAINDWQTVRQAAEAGVIPRIRRDGDGWAVEQNGAFVKVGSRDEALQIALSAVDENARTEAEALAKVAEAYSSGQDVLDLQLGTVRRLQDEGLSEQQIREFAVAEGMVNGLTREEAEQATWYVLGKNQLETKENVRRAVVSLYRGASVLDAVEEPVEARLKMAWESGTLTQEQTLDWIRTAADIMRAPELVQAAESGQKGMVEAVSDIVLADVFGQRKDGRKGVAGAITAGIKAKLRQNVTSKSASQFGQFLAAFRAFFAQVFRRARALAKARKEGRIGEDFDAFLDAVMGTPAQQRFEAETVKEGFAMFQDMMPEMPSLEGQPYSFSLSRVTPQQDTEYLAAVQAGDMETAQRLVDEAAKNVGYLPHGDFRDSHRAPSNQFGTDEDVRNGDADASLLQVARGVHNQPDDYFDTRVGPRYYSYQDKAGMEAFKAIRSAMDKIQLGKKTVVTVYRAVPVDIKGTRLENRDWVTPSKTYAVDHGESRFGKGEYRIIKESVPAESLFWDGNDIREWGKDDAQNYFYKNTANNIKSADPVTYDDAGNVIPLSQRFQPESPDIRFSLSRVTPQQDAEYLAAVQAGDMETAQRLVDEAVSKSRLTLAWRAVGGDVGSQNASGGFYATSKRAVAEFFAGTTGRVERVAIRLGKTQEVREDTGPDAYDSLESFRIAESEFGDSDFDSISALDIPDGPENSDVFVVRKQSQIKSADPITYDDNGNVIPLSQRFQPESPDIRFSLSRTPVDVADTFLAQRMRSPEFREIYFNAARDRLARLRKTKSWQAAQEPDASRKERQLAALKTLDTLLMAFPPEVRGKVGGFVKLASFETDAARAREIERRLEKLDAVVEEAAKKHYADIIADLFKRYAPGKDDKGRITSKLTPDAAADVAFAQEFSELEPAKQDETIAGIEKILAESEDSTEIQDAIGRLGITQLFQRLDEQESAQLETAANWLQGIVTGAREARRVLDAARAEYVKEAKAQAKLDASNGKFSELPDAENLEADIRSSTWKTFSAQIKGVFNAVIFQVGQQIENVFGADSRITTEFHKRAVRAANQSTDLKIDIERRRQKAATRIFKTESRIAQAGKMGLLQKPRQSGVFINVGGKTQKVEVPADVVRRLIAGEVTPQSMDLQASEVDLLKAQYDEEQAKPGNRRKRVFTLERPSVGRSTELKMSEDEGIQYLLWSRQQASREQLERDGWTEESFKQLEQFLSPEAKALADFIADEYERLGNLIAPVYERLFHAPFPRVRNYAPIYRDITSADSIIDLEQQGMGSGLSSGFVLARNKNARSALRRTSAVSAFLQHAESAAHWISHVELVRDMRSILTDKEVQNAIRAAGRSASANGLKKRIKQLENRGTLQAAGIAEIDGWFSKMLQARAFKALAFKISPVIKQTSALFNPLLGDVPAWEYMRGMAKLMSGQLDIKSMWNSPDIRRRLEGGFSAEARIAMEGLSYSKAGPIGQVALSLLSKGMVPMQFMDAVWTTVGAAISFDYYKRQNMKAGMNETQAENEARQQLEMLIAETAQPADAANRALVEGIANPWLKSMWMFGSESRKTLAIEIMALKRLATGKSKNIGMDLQRAIVAHVLMAATTQLMSGVLALLMGDEDDREREWSAEEWAAAIIAGPINGLFVLGDLLEYSGRRLFGLYAFEPKTPIAQSANALLSAPKAVEDLIDGDPEEQRRALFKLSEAIGTAAAFTPVGAANPFTAADVILGNSLKDVDKILTRLDE